MNEVKRIFKLEKFFNVKKPKNINWLEWGEKLYEMSQDWENQHHEVFPI